MIRVLITDFTDRSLPEMLNLHGMAVDYLPEISRGELLKIIPDYQGVIINTRTIADRELMDSGVRLMFIGRLGSGLDIIDVEYARKRNIKVLSTPEANSRAVAEHALGMLLSVANRFKKGQAIFDSQKIWDREVCRGFELENKTIGIIGVGNNGSAFTRLLQPFGMNILLYDKYRPAGYALEFPYAKASSLEEIYREAEIISFHIPLTLETRHWVDEQFFNAWQNPRVLINISRGKVVKTEALVSALKQNTLDLACLDVFENENPNTYSTEEQNYYKYLSECERVLCTPHVAGWTIESKQKIATMLANKILSECASEALFT
jgi:D-3-phosphoglycerate dehydrogenase